MERMLDGSKMEGGAGPQAVKQIVKCGMELLNIVWENISGEFVSVSAHAGLYNLHFKVLHFYTFKLLCIINQ